jgi:K+-sensing histidine kinase KdpD
MIDSMLHWLRRLQNYDLEGTVLSFLVCQVALAIVATGSWMTDDRISVLLFVPTVLLAGFFLRLVDGVPLLFVTFLAIWYYVVPPSDSFALSATGAIELAVFVVGAALLMLGMVGLRRRLERTVLTEPAERHQAPSGSIQNVGNPF